MQGQGNYGGYPQSGSVFHYHQWQGQGQGQGQAGPPASFPANLDQLRELVASMRELGVASAFGVVLGPEPGKAEKLAQELAKADGVAKVKLTEELREELARVKRAEQRQQIRDMIGDADMTDEACDKYLPAEGP